MTKDSWLSNVIRNVELGAKAAGQFKRKFDDSVDRARKKARVEPGITSQHDSRLQYSKRRMPRRRRRAWKSFYKKFKAAELKAIGTSTVLRNDQVNEFATYDASASPSRLQTVAAACLFGKVSSTTTGGWNDMATIVADDSRLNGSAKMLFSTGILDVTVTNTATNTVNLEVDVYHIRCAGTGQPRDLTNNPYDYFTNAAAQTGTMGGTLNIFSRGATPFEFPAAIKLGRWKIIKKYKHFITNGQCFTYQVKDPRNWVYDTSELNLSASATHMYNYQPGRTQFLLFVAKPVAGQTPTNNTNLITVGITRKYCYKAIQYNYDQSGVE